VSLETVVSKVMWFIMQAVPGVRVMAYTERPISDVVSTVMNLPTAIEMMPLIRATAALPRLRWSGPN
jgi:hypothetical protein